MTKSRMLTFGLVGALSGAVAEAKSGKEPAVCIPLTVRVSNPVVDDETLKRAERVAERVFRSSGVEIAWLDCPVGGDPTCTTPGPREISLRIFRRYPGERRRIGEATGGMAVRQPAGAGIVHVFYDRLEEAASSLAVPVDLVLGVTAAHEIGHVLLRPGHSLSGIMSANLAATDWHRAAQGWLSFGAGETAVMRDAVCGPAGTQ